MKKYFPILVLLTIVYDISIPKDGVVNGEDLSRFFMLWNKYKGGL